MLMLVDEPAAADFDVQCTACAVQVHSLHCRHVKQACTQGYIWIRCWVVPAAFQASKAACGCEVTEHHAPTPAAECCFT